MTAVNELMNSGDQYKAIGINTCHILQSDAERLTLLGDDPAVGMILARDSGAFVKLYPDMKDEPRVLEADYPGFSEAFYNVLGQAKLAGFTMVEFDNAATGYDALPAFEW
jgi:hypothetical protein